MVSRRPLSGLFWALGEMCLVFVSADVCVMRGLGGVGTSSS